LFRNGAAFGARAGWTWIWILLGEIDFCAHVPKARARGSCPRRDTNKTRRKRNTKRRGESPQSRRDAEKRGEVGEREAGGNGVDSRKNGVKHAKKGGVEVRGTVAP